MASRQGNSITKASINQTRICQVHGLVAAVGDFPGTLSPRRNPRSVAFYLAVRISQSVTGSIHRSLKTNGRLLTKVRLEHLLAEQCMEAGLHSKHEANHHNSKWPTQRTPCCHLRHSTRRSLPDVGEDLDGGAVDKAMRCKVLGYETKAAAGWHASS